MNTGQLLRHTFFKGRVWFSGLVSGAGEEGRAGGWDQVPPATAPRAYATFTAGSRVGSWGTVW